MFWGDGRLVDQLVSGPWSAARYIFVDLLRLVRAGRFRKSPNFGGRGMGIGM